MYKYGKNGKSNKNATKSHILWVGHHKPYPVGGARSKLNPPRRICTRDMRV